VGDAGISSENQKVDDASVRGGTTVAENVRYGQNISESGMGGKATEVNRVAQQGAPSFWIDRS
jgi:hypothetical protein